MTPKPEHEWSVEVHLRGRTFGTEAQAHATAERWHQLVTTAAGRDVELAKVVLHDPETGHHSDECRARVFHGPGHQSRTPCERVDAHELHEARFVVAGHIAGHTVYWRGVEATTGTFDESPLEEDDPYTYVESRGYWVTCCKACDDGKPLPIPYPSQREREDWITAHTNDTSHTEYYLVDPEGDAQIDEADSWSGTVAYLGVETTDGRVLEELSWPHLAVGPLPVVLFGTGEQVGTITEVWRELVEDARDTLEQDVKLVGAMRIRARGTIRHDVVGADGRIAVGIDVDHGEVTLTDGRFTLRGGRLLGVTIYPEGSDLTSAWPDAALQLEETET